MDRLHNKVAIITGATMGIGETAARRFFEEGAHVVIGARSKDIGEALAADLGERCRYYPLDVADYDNWNACIAYTLKEFGKLDILINNAGISVAETIADTTPESYDRIIDVNQKGVFYGMKTAIDMKKAWRSITPLVTLGSRKTSQTHTCTLLQMKQRSSQEQH